MHGGKGRATIAALVQWCTGGLERIVAMGDRVLFQVVSGTVDAGPVVYCHWAGARAPEIVRRLAERMSDRPDDMDYATARLVQECVNGDAGALSFGVWNATRRLDAEDSHGDAGVVLIDCTNGFRCTCVGGYLVTDADGFPALPRFPATRGLA